MLRDKRKYETREIPRFVERTISEAGEVGAGGEVVGCLILKKMCTVYILKVHTGKKRILHI